MLSLKPQRLNKVSFIEGQDANQILLQVQYAVRKMLILISGPIVISAKVGTISPTTLPAPDGTTLFPYLLKAMGALTFNGARKDNGKGIKVNNLPVWALWLEAYILNKGVGPVVDDGGMQAAGFAPGTYQVSVSIPVNFFDPKVPVAQQPTSYFRPVCYNKQPFWILTGGTLFQANFQGNTDFVALTGDTTTNASLTYDMSGLTIQTTAYQVPAMKMSPGDQCADIAYEYNFQPDLNNGNYNNVGLADLEVQAYIHMINTDLQPIGGGTAFGEAGADSFGAANNGIIETDIGTDPIAQPYAVNQKQEDYDEFMTSVSAWPEGVLTIDEYGHNWAQFKTKTFLQPGIATHFVNAYGLTGNNGSNFRIIHKTFQLSGSAKAAVGTFPKFAGQ